jgi:stringent starvation protein B
MASTKPYLIRAMYEWISDSGWTPYLVINTKVSGCTAPPQHMDKEQVVFNIAMQAVHKLLLGNEAIEFSARFSGVSRQIYVPIEAVMAIYAQENGRGMNFPPEAFVELEDEKPAPQKGKPDLKIVK